MEIEYTYNQYVDDILTGRIKSCEAIYLACERYKAFMNRSDMYFDDEDVQRKIRVVARLKHSTGIHNGKSFILLPWQQWCIASIFGFKWKSTGYRVTKNAFIMVSRKGGKALALDTQIPTPEGLTTMGSLKVGDQVFDENGKPCNVTFVTPVMYDHKCYKITFSDGDVITADADHNWYVQRYRSKWHVETTREIIEKGYYNKRKDGYVEKYVCIPAAKPLEYKSTSTLPIDPYTLGLWLGDGCKNKPKLTINGDDCSELVSHIPYPYTLERYDDENAYDVNLSGKQQSDFSKLLISNDLKGNKHIPEEYFFASVNDRLALLQGIMDTDGSISINKTNGSARIEIQQVNENLAKGICRLLDSLCIKYYACKKIPTLNGKPCNEVTRITFNGDKTLPVFRLKRKYDLLKDRKGKRDVKYITKIEETESVPVKCITVDSPNHLYLCGNNTVTHNTATAAAIGILCAIADNEPGAEIDLVANSRHQAKIAFKQSSNFCESVDKEKKIFKRYRDTINIPKTKSIIQVLSSDAMGNDGYNASCFILDEFHAARSWDLYNVLKSSQGMRSQPLAIIITSAGFLLNGYPCYEHRLTCMDILKGNKVDDTQFSAIYELDEEDDWLDESNWIKCSPSLGQTVQIDYLRDQVQSVKNNPSLETGVKTKNFNIFCQSKNVWIPEKYLKDVWHKVDVDNFIDEDCYMGVDLSSVSDITASAIMFPPNPERAIYPDKYVFKPYVYLPVDNLAENTNEELYRLWYRQGFLDCTPGNVVDYDQILKDQIDIYNKTYLQNVAYDEWNASSWAADAYAEGLPIKGYSQTVGNFNKPTKTFEMLIRSGKVIIDYNPLVRWCFNNVEIKMDYNGNCLALDTIVPTPNGFTTIDQIKVGDYVFDQNGKPIKVIGVTDVNYGRDCYKMTFYNGAEVVADYTHNWYINYQSSHNHKAFMTYGTKNTEWIFKHYINTQGKRWIHTIMNGAVEYPTKTYTVDPYTLGQWLGDGCSWGSQFTCEEKDLVMYKHLEDKYTVRYKYDEGNTYNVYVSGGLRTELKSLNLLCNKHIPEEYLYGDIEQRLQLLRGLMDTDGTCHKTTGQCKFTQSNKHESIISGVDKLLSSLGIRHTIRRHENHTDIQFYTDLIVFNLERKIKNQKLYKKSNLNNHNPIMKVEKVDSVPTKCITVDSEDHLFLITDKYLVTSNCKPIKGGSSNRKTDRNGTNTKKIDPIIAMLEALGGYLDKNMNGVSDGQVLSV